MKIVLNVLWESFTHRLNRDDSGESKSVFIGGTKRSEVSSQCRKRAWRELFQKFLPKLATGMRTGNLDIALFKRLENRKTGIVTDTLRLLSEVAASVFVSVNKKDTDSKDDDKADDPNADVKSKGMSFLSEVELDGLVDSVIEAYKEVNAKGNKKVKKVKKVKAKGKKSEDKKSYESLLGFNSDKVRELFFKKFGCLPEDAADVGAFGRFLAADASLVVKSAVKASPSHSTHACSPDDDFFVAKEEFQIEGEILPKEQRGAAHMGHQSLVSACYHETKVIDVGQLFQNYHVDSKADRKELLDALVTSGLTSVPSGGQNGALSQEYPAYVIAYVAEGQEVTTAGAFDEAIRANGGSGYREPSIKRLSEHWENSKSAATSCRFKTLGLKADFRYRLSEDKKYHLGDFIEEVINAALE